MPPLPLIARNIFSTCFWSKKAPSSLRETSSCSSSCFSLRKAEINWPLWSTVVLASFSSLMIFGLLDGAFHDPGKAEDRHYAQAEEGNKQPPVIAR